MPLCHSYEISRIEKSTVRKQINGCLRSWEAGKDGEQRELGAGRPARDLDLVMVSPVYMSARTSSYTLNIVNIYCLSIISQ